MVIFGSRLFGKVDEIPGLGFVATKFGHINFVPLIPLEGWLVTAEEGDGWRGQAIPMSGKSVLVAWARFLFIVAGLISLVVGFVAFGDHEQTDAIVPGVLALSCIAGLIASYKWKWVTHASPERAMEIAREAGIGEEGLDQLRRMYAASEAATVAVPAQPWTPPES
ncbi:hypothetical protein HRD49_37300 [Corallococcus exiguus]|uniref:Uncharacterized protein n=1 Tax=Corallococcus exiguus TaxID=83462 RepID=A0A7X4Y8T6_9BACT|nr:MULTISPECIES: hypothetical protein [Corallococcus]NBC40706.1 hypothetical protein [Corallococcus exiguus]NPC76115.1 hypothetical protein [Corallococcus exiguus]NPD29852.1 hypothetical protein [Corallococcus exiguus]NRD50945.1 hypothetical protein [Corallococcus exiguus]NRD67410.1 hypothetical protein [Corallococcus exiguus]